MLFNKPEILINKKFIVCIDSWLQESKFPLGRLVKIIGDKGNIKVENDVILFENFVDTRQFSNKVLSCLPKIPFIIQEKEYRKRKDFRNIPICSVDPPGCKDIDDALHGIQLSDNLFEIGVHIADVTHFVKPDSDLDLEAQRRGTTVYLVDRRTDMLPKLLTEDLCSLRSGVERLAFSAIFQIELSNNYESGYKIINVSFGKSIIKSRYSLTYEQAQNIINN